MEPKRWSLLFSVFSWQFGLRIGLTQPGPCPVFQPEFIWLEYGLGCPRFGVELTLICLAFSWDNRLAKPVMITLYMDIGWSWKDVILFMQYNSCIYWEYFFPFTKITCESLWIWDPIWIRERMMKNWWWLNLIQLLPNCFLMVVFVQYKTSADNHLMHKGMVDVLYPLKKLCFMVVLFKSWPRPTGQSLE